MYGIDTISGKIKSLFNRDVDTYVLKYIKDNPTAQYDSSLWNQSSVTDLALLREIPNLLRDGTITAALSAIMETAFAVNQSQKIIWPVSKYSTITKELTKFHKHMNIEDLILIMGYNLLLWGNVPYKHVFRDGILDRVTPIPDFTKVVPIVVSGKTLGYLHNQEYHYPYEYTYAQTSYYRNMGGIYKNNMIVSSMPDDVSDGVVNEFTFAPSYLMGAVAPWRSINIVEQCLLLHRMDSSNYYRIISVDVGTQVTSKAAIRTLSYYKNLFQKVRRVSWDPSGMAGKGVGQNFEVIIPKNRDQGVEVKDVGGETELRAIKDLDQLYAKLFCALHINPDRLGFSNEKPNAIGETGGLIQDSRFAKACSTIHTAVVRAIKNMDLIYLRSKGFNVDDDDWSYGSVGGSLIEDERRQNSLKISLENAESLQKLFNASKVSDNKQYFIESFLGQSLTNCGVNLQTLFKAPEPTPETEGNDPMASGEMPPDNLDTPVMSGVSFEARAKLEALNDLAFSRVISEAEVQRMSEGILNSREVILSRVKSINEKVVRFEDYKNLITSRVFDIDTELDLTGLVTSKKAVFSGVKNKQVLSFTEIPISFPVCYQGKLDLTIRDFDNAPVRAIESVIVSGSQIEFTNRDDLVDYLNAYKEGNTSIFVNKLEVS